MRTFRENKTDTKYKCPCGPENNNDNIQNTVFRINCTMKLINLIHVHVVSCSVWAGCNMCHLTVLLHFCHPCVPLHQHESALNPKYLLWQILAAWAMGAGHHITGTTTLCMFTLPHYPVAPRPDIMPEMCVTLWFMSHWDCKLDIAGDIASPVMRVPKQKPKTSILLRFKWNKQDKVINGTYIFLQCGHLASVLNRSSIHYGQEQKQKSKSIIH